MAAQEKVAENLKRNAAEGRLGEVAAQTKRKLEARVVKKCFAKTEKETNIFFFLWCLWSARRGLWHGRGAGSGMFCWYLSISLSICN